MTTTHGRFQWYELMTTDPEAARNFYSGVLGWSARDASMPEMKYTLLVAGETPVAGLMELPEPARKAGATPHWIGSVGADDVDRTVEQAKQRGASVHVPPTDIPGVGRFAVLADPQSAHFSLLKWLDPAMNVTSGQDVPGHVGWHELLAADWPRAMEFYGALFGWKPTDAVDMGEMGTYQLFGAGGPPIGGMFNKPPPVPVPFWQYYFNVGAIDAAAERVKAGGGQVANGPMEVPGGMWIVHCIDPQGAMFALVGKPPAG